MGYRRVHATTVLLLQDVLSTNKANTKIVCSNDEINNNNNGTERVDLYACGIPIDLSLRILNHSQLYRPKNTRHRYSNIACYIRLKSKNETYKNMVRSDTRKHKNSNNYIYLLYIE